MDNDQSWFKKLLTDDSRSYKTAIVFGDNDWPGYAWNNRFNSKNGKISEKDGKELCLWKIDKLISFHTRSREGHLAETAGYARWFEPEDTEHIKDWVKYLE